MTAQTAADRIQQARDVALDILQPTDSELEHGLELHRDSVVIETYGLGFRASVGFCSAVCGDASVCRQYTPLPGNTL